MRATHQVLELALKYPHGDAMYLTYMCWQLQRMYGNHVIDFDEFSATKKAVLAAIGGHSTLAGFLRAHDLMPRDMSIYSAEYLPVRNTFYYELMHKLRATDPMYLIIEAAYHCCHSEGEIHAAIKAAGLPETSDETVMNLLGEYAESIME